jgi:hypothetical protein
MSFVRNLAADLVEKRLWPIAAALLAAILAVPLLLGGGGSTPTPAAGDKAVAAAAAPESPVRVTLDTSTSEPRNRRGAVRNPFRQQHQPKAAAAPGPAAPAAGGASAATGSASATGPGASSPSGTTATPGNDDFDPKTGLVKHTTTPVPSTTAVDSPAVAATGLRYRVAWRFGRPRALKSNHDAARLTALPKPADPVVLFLGLLEDRRTAAFLVRPGATVTGEGWCRPAPTDCQTLEMRRGDVVGLAYTDAAGVLQRYRLGVSTVARRTVSVAAARRSHRRVSKAGREVLIDAIRAKVPGTRELVFDAARGLLKPVE